MHAPCCDTGFCVLYWFVILHPPYEPFLALLLFFKVHICQNLHPAVIKALPSEKNINFQWRWDLENTNDSMKNVCLWKWEKQREKPFMRTWGFTFSKAELFLAIAGIMVNYNLLTIFQWSAHSSAV